MPMEEKKTGTKNLKNMIRLVVFMSLLLIVGFGFVVYGLITQYNDLMAK